MVAETEWAQWFFQFVVRQWSWNLVAAGVGFYIIIMTRRILLGSAKLSIATGVLVLGASSTGVIMMPSGEYIFSLLGNLALRVGIPDGLTVVAFGIVGGVAGIFYNRAPEIENKKKKT